jgi:hypothetical protein
MQVFPTTLGDHFSTSLESEGAPTHTILILQQILCNFVTPTRIKHCADIL